MHPQIDALIGAHFNQDSAYIADTLEGLVDDWKRTHHPHEHAALCAEIDAFLAAHPADADAAFDAAWGFDVDPATWGHDAASFLRRVAERVRG